MPGENPAFTRASGLLASLPARMCQTNDHRRRDRSPISNAALPSLYSVREETVATSGQPARSVFAGVPRKVRGLRMGGQSPLSSANPLVTPVSGVTGLPMAWEQPVESWQLIALLRQLHTTSFT